MKIYSVIILVFLISNFSNAQTLKEYKASNGEIYHAGDTIIMGYGSMPNGDFKCVQMGGWAAVLGHDSKGGSDQNNLGKGYAGYPLILKKIKSYSTRGINKVYFIVGGGNITNYNLMIEDAIEFCEIKICKDSELKEENTTYSKYDELEKLKDLFDSGAINQQEYDSEKAKLLQKD